MNNSQARIERLLNEPINFKFSDYLSRGYELFQKDMGNFIIYALIFFALTMVIGFIPIVGSLANSFVVTPALTAGLYLYAQRLDKGERPEFGTFFKGFDYVGQLALGTLVMWLIIGVTLLPIVFLVKDSEIISWYKEVLANPGTPPTELPVFDIPWWTLLLALPAMFLGILYAWTPFFIVLFKMEFWPAMEASRKLVIKNWLIFFLFNLVVGFIAGIGALLCCVGILFTYPAAMCMSYAAFADVSKVNLADEEGEIEQHLIS